MKRLLLVVAVVALLAAACGTTSDGAVEVAPVTPTQAGQSSGTVATTSPGSGDTAAPAAPSTSATNDPATTSAPAPPKAVDGPAAPDFTLALADGRGDFVLSAEQKPVFMVFWAEW